MQLTTNTRAFIESEQYSKFILLNLHDGLLPEAFYRNVSDFGSGETLHIKTIGTVAIQDGAEDTPLTYSPIESGEVQLKITEYIGDGWYVTDELREDGTQVDSLMAARSQESTRAIQETFESRFLKTAATAMSKAEDYKVNGWAHKIVSAETDGVFALKYLIAMRLAFQKANAPDAGNIFICDPTVEATLNGLVNITTDVTPFAAEIIKGGMTNGMRFIMNLYGWDIMTSNRLHHAPANDGTTSLASGVHNLFMNILDDNTKPIMAAWRRMPKAEGERNKDYRRDEFNVTARFGFGVQRLDTLGVLVTNPAKY